MSGIMGKPGVSLTFFHNRGGGSIGILPPQRLKVTYSTTRSGLMSLTQGLGFRSWGLGLRSRFWHLPGRIQGPLNPRIGLGGRRLGSS